MTAREKIYIRVYEIVFSKDSEAHDFDFKKSLTKCKEAALEALDDFDSAMRGTKVMSAKVLNNLDNYCAFEAFIKNNFIECEKEEGLTATEIYEIMPTHLKDRINLHSQGAFLNQLGLIKVSFRRDGVNNNNVYKIKVKI